MRARRTPKVTRTDSPTASKGGCASPQRCDAEGRICPQDGGVCWGGCCVGVCEQRAVNKELLAALTLVDLHFSRNHVSGNFQGDDEHEAWSAVRNAIAMVATHDAS